MKAVLEQGARDFVLTMGAAATWESSYAPAAGQVANEVRLRQAIRDARIACGRMERLLNGELSGDLGQALRASRLVTGPEADAVAGDTLVEAIGMAIAGELARQHGAGAWDNLGDGESLYWLGHVPDKDDASPRINVVEIAEALVKKFAAAVDDGAALRTAIGHIEHMAAWIGKQRQGHCYSFESLGEDMPGIRAAAAQLPPVLGLKDGAEVTTRDAPALETRAAITRNVVTLITGKPASAATPTMAVFFTMDTDPGFYFTLCDQATLFATVRAGMFLGDPAKLTASDQDQAADMAACLLEFGHMDVGDGSISLRRGLGDVAIYLYEKVCEFKREADETDATRFAELELRKGAEARFTALQAVLIDALGDDVIRLAKAAGWPL